MNRQSEVDRLRPLGWCIEDRLELRDDVWAFQGDDTATAFGDHVQDAMAAVADTSWWYRTRNVLLLDLVESAGVDGPLWEIGAGTGAVASAFQRHGIDVVAVEPSASGIRTAQSRGVHLALQATLAQLRLPDQSIRSIGLFDVLEHLDEPDSTLREIRRVLIDGGHLVLSVPAMRWLWSNADSDAGHRCRYTRKTLRRELESAGFRVEHLSYRFSSMVLPVALTRALRYRLGRRSALSEVYEQVGKDPGRLGAIAANFERRLGGRMPLGTSIFAVARPASTMH
jgi:ubiquinone/menaquinone biosynthesis C-methylase UbiE